MLSCLLFFVFLVAHCAPLFLTYAAQPEIQALLSFKQTLHDPLNALSNWDTSTSAAPCDWHGVACNANNRVTELRLPSLQLGGRLSDLQLSSLEMLTKLSLRNNSFNGSVPSTLWKCTFLRALFLQYNSFSGEISPEIRNLTKLEVFNIAGNQFSGGIPGSLPKSLRYVDLSSNSISGLIPVSVKDLSELQFVNFSYNELSGEVPAGFGKLQKLEYLWLDYNVIEGTIPSALGNCSSLVHFSAEGNLLRGVVPAGIGGLPKLQVVSLSRNNLSGSVPGSIFCNGSGNEPSVRIVQLGFNRFTGVGDGPGLGKSCYSVVQVLDLSHNAIRGEFPRWIVGISSLTKLDVSGNLFDGALPREIGGLRKLDELKMANNSFSGGVPEEIKKCGSLRVLDLEGNKLTGGIPEFLGYMRGLVVLSLGRNQFSGMVPSSFGNLLSLETLDLRENGLNGSFPEVVIGLKSLTTLDLSGNGFFGEIPESIGNLSRLMVLDLSGNMFSGRIPGSVGNLFRLTTLDLSKQNLSGELPNDLSGLPNLQVIALQKNNLSGDVPEGLSSLTGLQYLNLSSNNFSGHIPATYGFLWSLVVLSLSNNSISGEIPPELGNCSDLQFLELRSNSLTGHIPADLSHLLQLKVLDLGRNSLTGKIPEDISACASLTGLLVDVNHLSGNIPDSLSELSNLTMMDLSVNNLSGVIPANLTRIAGLVDFNVSHNNLEGEIPEPLGYRINNASAFANNQNLCGRPLNRKCDSTAERKRRKKMIMFIVIIAFGACLLALFCCFYIIGILRWRKKIMERAAGEKKHTPARASSGTTASRGSSDNGVPKLVMFNNKITLAETIEATRQFDEENVLSRTKHGLLFKACYNDGMVLSIRRLPDGSLDENMFRKEAESLGKVRHRNLTVLRGYYAGPPDLRLLVFDYMPNGNLATLLQEASHQDGHVLNWPMRHLIALGIARGLAFLHTCAMVHGDVKPQNVLFDADFEAHLSDFGLERFMVAAPAEASSSTTVGTLGYISPEATLTGEATLELDVYSFGIVLLELLTGKRPVMFTQDEDIVKWVKRQLQRGQITELLDPGLLELDPESSEWEEFLLGVKVALLCTAPDPLDRPTMSDIVFMLEGCRVGPDMPSSADPTSQPSPAQPEMSHS